MDNKSLVAVGIVAILLVSGVAVFMVSNQDVDVGEPSVFEDAGLKVYGNINGDWYLDSKDAKLIQQLIDKGEKAENYPLADTNNDGVLDSKDVDIVNKVVNREPTELIHVNYHDTDKNGVPDEEIVKSKFPISSCIITASTNVAMSMFTMGLIDEVKGASYSKSLDVDLFGDTYLNTDKVEKLSGKSGAIPFEDGKAGASDIIKRENVTALITDWNRTYITNEADFENANVDVIRISGAATEDADIIHTNMLLGLMFDKVDRAESLTNNLLNIVHFVDNAVKGLDQPKAIASSMDGYISSENSDYTQAIIRGGCQFAIPDVDFGTSTSIKIVDHPEIMQKDIDYVIHMRSNLDYGQTTEEIKSLYEKYTAAFKDLKNGEDGQYMVSGTIPMVLRIAYTTCAVHPECIDQDRIDAMHQNIVDQFYNGKSFDVSELTFFITPEDAKNW